MSALFSPEWCTAAAQAFNADPDAARALHGWVGAVGLVAGEVGVLLRAEAGRVTFERMSPAELEVQAPPSQAKASLETWGALIADELDPIAAVVQGRLTLRGDVQQLVARLGYRGLAERWLTAIRKGI